MTKLDGKSRPRPNGRSVGNVLDDHLSGCFMQLLEQIAELAARVSELERLVQVRPVLPEGPGGEIESGPMKL